MSKNKGVILLSGGLDSAVTAALAKEEGFQLEALTFRYNQKHLLEVDFARKLVSFFNLKKQVIIDIPAEIFQSALISKSNLKIYEGGQIRTIEKNDIPATYVPARNIIFLSYALAYAESVGVKDIFIGANIVDYSGYPDCRPEFFEAFSQMAQVGTKAGVKGDNFKIKTPLLYLSKAEIIKKGFDLGVDFSLTHSCYQPQAGGLLCGRCDSCLIRKKGFAEAKVEDPGEYLQE